MHFHFLSHCSKIFNYFSPVWILSCFFTKFNCFYPVWILSCFFKNLIVFLLCGYCHASSQILIIFPLCGYCHASSKILPSKRLFAFSTAKWLFTCVDHFMYLQITTCFTCLVTLVACIHAHWFHLNKNCSWLLHQLSHY